MSALLVLASPAQADEDLGCNHLPGLFRTFLQKHITYHHLNDELRSRTAATYLKRLDPSKALYLTGETAPLKAKLRGIFLDVENGDCVTLLEVHENLITRVKKMEEFVRTTLESDDYEVDASVTLILDPDKRSRPATELERNRLTEKLLHFQMTSYMSNNLEFDKAKEKLIHRYELVTKRARERNSVDIYAAFLDSFARALDPHSNYLSAEDMEDFQIGMDLSLEGIGVALSSQDGYSVVEKIIPGGAADRIGVFEPKDKIIGVAQEDGELIDIVDMDLRDVVRLIRGKRGTKVYLSVLRQTENTELFNVTIVRDKINLEEQAASLRFETIEIPAGIGEDDTTRTRTLKLALLDLPSFYGGRNPSDRQSSRDLRRLLQEVKAEGAHGLLLDLSRNGGGLLNEAVDIAGYFIDEGGIVAVRAGSQKVQVMQDPDESTVFDGPMVILTSRVSASASEIVAGAMKDYGRAVLVGDDHTFGKGTVQSMQPLPQGLGALKVTTAVFFRPDGDSTQHEGVATDVLIPSVIGVREIGEMHHDYSMPGQEITAFVQTPTGADVPNTADLDWLRFDNDHLKELQRRSDQRVSVDEEFREIQKQADKILAQEGVVHLADLIKDQEAREKSDSADDSEEALDSPQEKGVPGLDAESPSTDSTEANRFSNPIPDRHTTSLSDPGAKAPRGTYRIKPGDTLSTIASQHGIETRELARLNGLSNPDRIQAGQLLRTPAQQTDDSEQVLDSPQEAETPEPDAKTPSTASAEAAGDASQDSAQPAADTSDEDDEDEPSLHQQEALRILADHVTLLNRR